MGSKGCSLIVGFIGLLSSCVGIYGFLSGNTTLNSVVDSVQLGDNISPALIAFLGGVGLTVASIIIFKMLSLSTSQVTSIFILIWAILFTMAACGFLEWVLYKIIVNQFGEGVSDVTIVCLVGMYIFFVPISIVGAIVNVVKDELW